MIGSVKKLLTGASTHRTRARAALRGNWACAVFVALLAGLLGVAGTTPTFRQEIQWDGTLRFYIPDHVDVLLRDVLGVSLSVAILVAGLRAVAGLLLGGVMELGSARYHLKLCDRRDAGLRDLFSGMLQFRAALVMQLLRMALIVTGLLLLAVPGLVMSCGLAMAPYILAEDPACRGTESLRRSWELMRGHKLELLTLELSFLGWILLSAFSLGIGPLLLNPYMAAAKADFYRKLSAQA